MSLYGKVWAARSAAFLRRYPVCGMRPTAEAPVMSRCYEQGLRTPATQTDHVRPHRGDEGRFWNEQGWQALCDACHGRKTRWENSIDQRSRSRVLRRG